MVRALSAVLLLGAAPVFAAAPLALPSFEAVALQLQSSVHMMRREQIKAASPEIKKQIDSIAWDLRRADGDLWRLNDDLRYLMSLVRRSRGPGRPGPGRPGGRLGWDLQRFNRELARQSEDAWRRLNDLRTVSSQIAEKDPSLVDSATQLSNAGNGLESTSRRFTFDARFAVGDLNRAGYWREASDLDRYSRQYAQTAQDLKAEAERLLAKVR